MRHTARVASRRVLSDVCLAVLSSFGIAAATGAATPASAADDEPAYGPELQGFEYPWPVSYFSFTSQGEQLRMAYMDVKPTAAANGRTVGVVSRQEFLRGDLARRHRAS